MTENKQVTETTSDKQHCVKRYESVDILTDETQDIGRAYRYAVKGNGTYWICEPIDPHTPPNHAQQHANQAITR